MRIHYKYRYKKKSAGLSLIALIILGIVTIGLLMLPEKAESKATKPNEIEETEPNQKATKPNDENRKMIIREANTYGIKPSLAVAISRLETGNWTSEAYTEGNNFGGLTVNGQVLKFENKEQGVKRFIDNLYEIYIMNGLDTPEEIAPVYCPPNAEKWAVEVRKIMKEEETR